MKRLIIGMIVVIGTSVSAFALKKWNGRNEAAEVCFAMTFEDEKKECIDLIRSSKYFDRGAVNICKHETFSSEKFECLKVIKDRYYENFEIRYCSGLIFDDERLECLANSGQPLSAGVQTPMIDLRRVSY